MVELIYQCGLNFELISLHIFSLLWRHGKQVPVTVIESFPAFPREIKVSIFGGIVWQVPDIPQLKVFQISLKLFTIPGVLFSANMSEIMVFIFLFNQVWRYQKPTTYIEH